MTILPFSDYHFSTNIAFTDSTFCTINCSNVK